MSSHLIFDLDTVDSKIRIRLSEMYAEIPCERSVLYLTERSRRARAVRTPLHICACGDSECINGEEEAEHVGEMVRSVQGDCEVSCVGVIDKVDPDILDYAPVR